MPDVNSPPLMDLAKEATASAAPDGLTELDVEVRAAELRDKLAGGLGMTPGSLEEKLEALTQDAKRRETATKSAAPVEVLPAIAEVAVDIGTMVLEGLGATAEVAGGVLGASLEVAGGVAEVAGGVLGAVLEGIGNG